MSPLGLSKGFLVRVSLGAGGLADSLGLEIQTLHDGIGVFGSETDPELDSKAAKLRDCIQERSLRLFGLKIQVKIDEPLAPAPVQAGQDR